MHFSVHPLNSRDKSLTVEAVVLAKVTSSLPVHPFTFNSKWKHLEGLQLTDPEFSIPCKVDVLLGVIVFRWAVLNSRRLGSPGCPSALWTCFGWVLNCTVLTEHSQQSALSYHMLIYSGNDLLRKFWEIEERSLEGPLLTSEVRIIMDHFHDTHHWNEIG